MNETQLLCDALFASPDDFTLAAALVEHLECDRGYWRSEAEKKVERIQRTGRETRDVKTANRMMADDSEVRPYMLDIMSLTCGMALVESTKLWITPGPQPPFCSNMRRAVLNHDWWLGTEVVVGAEWLLSTYRKSRHLIKANRRHPDFE